jgi:hypothetical protein
VSSLLHYNHVSQKANMLREKEFKMKKGDRKIDKKSSFSIVLICIMCLFRFKGILVLITRRVHKYDQLIINTAC